jgi:hypothetical protein
LRLSLGRFGVASIASGARKNGKEKRQHLAADRLAQARQSNYLLVISISYSKRSPRRATLATLVATFCNIHLPIFMCLARGGNFVRSVASDRAPAIGRLSNAMTLIRAQPQPAGTATWINSAIEVELSGAELGPWRNTKPKQADNFWAVGPGDVSCWAGSNTCAGCGWKRTL